MACDEAVYLSYLVIFIELWMNYSETVIYSVEGSMFQRKFHFVYFMFLAITLLLSMLNYWNIMSIWLKNPFISAIVPYFYLTDSMCALWLGYAITQRNFYQAVVSLGILSSCFLLCLVKNVYAPLKGKPKLVDELLGTSKQFIHHTANFLYLDSSDYGTIVVASVWRAISMSGHAAQFFKFKYFITPKGLEEYNWLLTHIRNVYVAFMFALCYFYPEVRNGFGRSASGHIAYILVRAGPVFRLGSVYVGDRPRWQNLTDYNRLLELFQGKHPYLTIEVGSLTALALYFLYLRLSLQ